MNNNSSSSSNNASGKTTAAATAAAPTVKTGGGTVTPLTTITDQAVLDYLRKKGLGSAVLELSAVLKQESSSSNTTTAPEETQSARSRLEKEDMINRNQRSVLYKSTGGNYGYDRDSAWPVVQWGLPDTGTANVEGMGVEEARAYLDAFCTVQLWVLGLPDDGGGGSCDNPIERAHKLLKGTVDKEKDVSLQTIMNELTKKTPSGTTGGDLSSSVRYNLPPSTKPELLAVTFALLVHTYCELLEVGMETTAHTVRDAFHTIYEPLYSEEYRDLHQCTTTEDMTRLNSHNSQHMEALATLKTILVQVASYQLHREELNAQTTVNGGSLTDQQQQAKDAKIAEYDRHISALKNKYNELSQKASSAFDKMYDLPFLRRARAVRWQLTLSTNTYGMLSAFLNTPDDSLLCMSTLLQTKCELHVERRDPLPFTPACVLDESEKGRPVQLNLNSVEINWAAPMLRSKEERERGSLPFPPYSLKEEYDNEDDAAKDKRLVEFNRALLVNGFRRLEALERKREYDVLPPVVKKRLKEGDRSGLTKVAADPLKPSILLTTLCASSTGPLLRVKQTAGSTSGRANNNSHNSSSTGNFTDVTQIWEEAGVGLCCAKICEPDGRRIAVGCDDSAVRIWNTQDGTTTGEPLQVLLGHKNGFPVNDVDWNRDGRSLLSGGGDGSVRLWDTMAVGPFGDVEDPTKPYISQESDHADQLVPSVKPESEKHQSGSALAVYRGHAPSSPVWSVAFSPSGYYFASSGGDATARLWTTDRMVPVRLFTGHSACNVNCVEWHPNCNYIITGSDDKTSRLWDIQTGRTVRLLTGCYAGVNAVRIDPSGRQAAVSDFSGIVHLWDLGSGKKMTELHSTKSQDNKATMVHALRFSSCGSALASGGDNCCVQIWDIRADSMVGKPMVASPTKSFLTKQTMLMDLYFTKRNLLLAAGKYVTPVPTAPFVEP